MSEVVMDNVVVRAYAPVDLPDGRQVMVDPLPETVRLEVFDPARPEVTLSAQELSYEQYEELRQSNPNVKYPALQKPKSGNTVAQAVGETASASVPASGANPPVKANVAGGEVGEALQSLVDKAEDTRSYWQKVKDAASGAWDGAKRMGEAVWDHPGEAGIGVLKGIGNLPTDIINLGVMAGKYATPMGMGANMFAEYLNAEALTAYRAGDVATANELASRAANIKNSGYVGNLFEPEGKAQEGGAILSAVVPLGGLVKVAGTAAKAIKGADAVADAAKAAKGADAASDAAKTAKGADTATDAAKGADGVIIKLKPKVIFERSQLQHAFKHAKDFGISGNMNNKTLAEFQSALQAHIDAVGTHAIQGTYRGTLVTHFVDPSTGLNVMSNSAGKFLSGWKLNPAQLENVLTRGKL
jgi:hypothetical protein